MVEWVFATVGFWRMTADRVIFSSAATALSLIGGGNINIVALDWQEIACLTAGSAVVTFLHSVLAERTPLPLSLEHPTEEKRN